MAEEPDRARLAALEEKLAKAKGAVEGPRKRHQEDQYSQAQLAWRMVIELVAGLGIGFGIGYGLDSLLGTMPLFLVLFILAGFAAGIKTMLRSAKEVQERKVAASTEREED
ncbi:AtpZ/AtpI family protein [Rhodobacteraceae bacterium HSP-20]|uniref:ATP synthase protein I n=1 Tax=Paragemmobacter amnigenus TaxID=2852097 RepID=A0ABS6J024_9RHOB|nr:AtpZ/AtpI family protein [Rhodobacter amnigenus]MBU9697100.1 AtpZ/AtpI family protein [Rhodobacter amnigenus]MBV4388327.1 AtpZ/AtpI family protein [Rhodobacter amnigenus]